MAPSSACAIGPNPTVAAIIPKIVPTLKVLKKFL
jgi:hypothetical protein